MQRLGQEEEAAPLPLTAAVVAAGAEVGAAQHAAEVVGVEALGALPLRAVAVEQQRAPSGSQERSQGAGQARGLRAAEPARARNSRRRHELAQTTLERDQPLA